MIAMVVSFMKWKWLACKACPGTLNKSSNIKRDKLNLSWLTTKKKPIKIQIFKMRNNEVFQEKSIKTRDNVVFSYNSLGGYENPRVN